LKLQERRLVMDKPVLTYHYEKGVTLTTKTKSFYDSVKFILERQEPTTFTPVKLVISSTGLTLYFDEEKFKLFINHEITQTDLIADTNCEGVFRNEFDIEIAKQDIIESGRLWKLLNKKYILIDKDRYLPIKFPDDNFKEI
jgi:hypothetical protein